MSWYLLLKLLHILAAVVTTGGMIARQMVRASARRTSNVRDFALLMEAAGKIDTRMVIPGSQAVLVLGIVLALVTGQPIFGFLQGATQNWLLAANLLLIPILVFVPAIFLPRGRQYRVVLEAALAEGQITPQLRATMEDKLVRFAHRYEEVAILAIIILMVTRPF